MIKKRQKSETGAEKDGTMQVNEPNIVQRRRV